MQSLNPKRFGFKDVSNNVIETQLTRPVYNPEYMYNYNYLLNNRHSIFNPESRRNKIQRLTSNLMYVRSQDYNVVGDVKIDSVHKNPNGEKGI
jgi:hypothetical protein